MDREAKLREIQSLLSRASALQSELAREDNSTSPWPPRYYTAYQIMYGCLFGAFGSATSLLFNVIGSLICHQHPLQLIRVYLTFPLGAEALTYSNNSVLMAMGVCLYLGTGMILGIPFQLMLSRWFARDRFITRFLTTSVLAIVLWLFNYYVVLSWLQPLLCGGSWIVDEIPWWVAASTHLIFGWTVLIAQPFGVFTPYGRHLEAA